MQINRKFKGFLWNSVGSGLVAFQTAIVVFLCSHLYTHEIAGIVSFSYAVAILVYTIARYGMRNYQATDSNEKYDFCDYLISRVITVLISFFVIVLYVGYMIDNGRYDADKVVIVIEIVLLRLVNAVEDVLFGRFQQIDNFEVGAKIMAIRELVSFLTICSAIFFRTNIKHTFAMAVLASLLTEIVLVWINRGYLMLGNKEPIIHRSGKVLELLRECLPLCIGTSLAIYASNIPKYVTDWYLDDYQQAIVGYLLLPVFTIALLNQFIYTPFIKDLGDLWNDCKISDFSRKICKQVILIGLSCLVITVVCLWIGIPILSILFNVDLSVYKIQFVFLLLGGALYTLEYYLTIPITVIRKQNHVALGYGIAIGASLIFQKRLVVNYGLVGTAAVYCIVNFIISGYLSFVLIDEVRRYSHNGG